MGKVVFNLSTLKTQKNVEKSSFYKSYTHYPHKNMCFWWITFIKKRTNVLLSYDEFNFLSKKISKMIDF